MRISLIRLVLAAVLLLAPEVFAAGGGAPKEMAYPEQNQTATFPIPLSEYERPEGASLMETLSLRVAKDPFNLAATIIFILAICHTFAAGFFMKLAHKAEHEHEERIRKLGLTKDQLDYEDAEEPVSFKATAYHFLGEIEAIFGIWIFALAAAATYFHGWSDFKDYVAHDRNFTEPMFVVIIMAIAASRPVLKVSELAMSQAAKIGDGSPAAWWFSVLTIAPILGSFITEPAAMTIGAMLLGKKFYSRKPSLKLAYATLGLLFVNVSVGGTLTHFAAPPVLMVAGKWNWDMWFMMSHFGYKAVVGLVLANVLFYFYFKKELTRINDAADGKEDGVMHALAWKDREDKVPVFIILIHLLFLAWTVYTAHEPVLFVGGFLFFLAFVMATKHHQNAISMKSPLLVGFFLAGLIVHGGCQGWWIEPIILALPGGILMFGSTVLTAFNDNAAITYLASQVDGLEAAKKYAVVAGAVTGGGLTVIANAPNPAGQSLLNRYFPGGISPAKLALGALVPTVILYICFNILPHPAMEDMPAPDPVEAPAHPMAPDATEAGTEENLPE